MYNLKMAKISIRRVRINPENRQIFVLGAGVLGALAVSLTLGTGIWLFRSTASVVDIEGSYVDSSTFEIEEPYRVVDYIVAAGETWGIITENLGLDWSTASVLLEASYDVHDLTYIHAGNELRFLFDRENDEFSGIEYDIDDERILVIAINKEGGFSAREEEIHYEIVQVKKQGIIESSLFETALSEGIPQGAIVRLAGIFAWDIDFASNVREGDSFAVVYEDRFREGEYVGPGRILVARFTNDGEDFFAFFYSDPEGQEGYYDDEGRELRRQFLRSPLDYSRITSGFSYNRYHPILNTFTTHRAIDYAASAGTPVSATADGTVTYVGWKGGNGKYVGIRHANSYSAGYAHLSYYAKGIKVGARVSQNQVIGFVGSTGLSTGPHLHYEMRKNGSLINPLRLDLPPGQPLNEEYIEDFFREKDLLTELLQFNGSLQ